MKSMHRHAIGLALTLTLAACSGESADPQASGTSDPELLEPAATQTPSPTPTASPEPVAEVKEIPSALRGRWALVPADCTSTRGDAKGLLTIGATTLKFYESVGTLKTATSGAPGGLSGTFSYTGEGMEWSREVTLVAGADGQTLNFADTGNDPPPSRRSYTKCK